MSTQLLWLWKVFLLVQSGLIKSKLVTTVITPNSWARAWMSRPTVNRLGPHSWWETEPIGCPASEDSRTYSYYCRCQPLHSQPVLCWHIPARGHHSVSPRVSLEAQHGGLPAMSQERFLSLLVFVCGRACDSSKQLDWEAWLTLQATELTYCP